MKYSHNVLFVFSIFISLFVSLLHAGEENKDQKNNKDFLMDVEHPRRKFQPGANNAMGVDAGVYINDNYSTNGIRFLVAQMDQAQRNERSTSTINDLSAQISTIRRQWFDPQS